MGASLSSRGYGRSPITQAKSLFSNGDVKGAFSVLKEAAWKDNAMACFDVGFMMIQRIGCAENWRGGMEMLEKGYKLVEHCQNNHWKTYGSVSELFEPQSMHLKGLSL